MLPPSSIDTGYKFIIARDRFRTKKVDRVSLFDVFTRKITSEAIRLKIIPPEHIKISFKYDTVYGSYDSDK